MDRPERLVLSVAEAAEMLGISRTLAYELVARQELPALRLGGRIVILLRPLQRLLDGGAAENAVDDGDDATTWAHDTPIFDEGIVTVGLSRQSVGSQADAAAGRGIGTVARGPRARFTSRSASTSREHPSPHPSTLLPRTPPPPHPISQTPLPHEPVLPETTPQRSSDICQPSGRALPARASSTC